MDLVRSRSILALVLLLSACAADVSTYTVEYSKAHVAAMAAWYDVVGFNEGNELECYITTKLYAIKEVGEVDCGKPLDPGRYYVGCAKYSERTLYILEDITEEKKAMVAVHEYIHAIAYCIFKNGDNKHKNILLWDEFDGDTVEVVGNRYLDLD